ncbi:MAG TPA: hypothetical protein VGM27_12100 [Acidobacteriaceae bacterium]
MSGAKQSIDNSRPLAMLFVSLDMAFAAFLRVLIGHTNLFLVAMAALWGFEYGMLTAREAEGTAGWVREVQSSPG